MTTAPVWIVLAIPIIVAVINVANAWTLELYKIRKSKETPISNQDKDTKTKESPSRRRAILIFIFNVCFVISQILGLYNKIAHPSTHPNIDALLISIHVTSLFFMALLWVMAKAIDKIFSVVLVHIDFTKVGFSGTSESVTKLSKITEEMLYIIKELTKKKKK